MPGPSLDVVKQKLVASRDLSEPMEAFFEYVEADPQVVERSTPCRRPLLEGTIREVAAQALGGRATLDQVMLTHLPSHELVHGALIISGRVASVLYFDDLHVGLLAVLTGDETRFARFTQAVMPVPARPELS